MHPGIGWPERDPPAGVFAAQGWKDAFGGAFQMEQPRHTAAKSEYGST